MDILFDLPTKFFFKRAMEAPPPAHMLLSLDLRDRLHREPYMCRVVDRNGGEPAGVNRRPHLSSSGCTHLQRMISCVAV
jgi:hypothetical protein